MAMVLMMEMVEGHGSVLEAIKVRAITLRLKGQIEQLFVIEHYHIHHQDYLASEYMTNYGYGFGEKSGGRFGNGHGRGIGYESGNGDGEGEAERNDL